MKPLLEHSGRHGNFRLGDGTDFILEGFQIHQTRLTRIPVFNLHFPRLQIPFPDDNLERNADQLRIVEFDTGPLIPVIVKNFPSPA